MTRSTWNQLASFSALIGFVLGLGPLAQWIITRRSNRLISILFGATTPPAAWLVPAGILLAAAVATLVFGARGDKAPN